MRVCDRNQMKRIDNVTRSPLFGHVAATASGLQTIHAYEKRQDFLTQYVGGPVCVSIFQPCITHLLRSLATQHTAAWCSG